jgi:cytochrome P450
MPDLSAWPFPNDEPFPAYHAARAEAPVRYDAGIGAHLVLSFEHVEAVLSNPGDWSSDLRKNPKLTARFSSTADIWAKTLVMRDPPVHTRIRKSVSRFFTARAVRAIRQRVIATIDAALEPLADGEPIELMNDIAYPIPLAVMCELFDVGLEGAQILREETPSLVGNLEPDPSPDALEEVNAAGMTVMLFLVPLIAERRSNPGEDLISAMLHPPDGGPPLDVDEVVMMCLSLLPAGFITTANLIGNGMLALLESPDQLRWLAANPDLAGLAVEELLRYDSPVQIASRVASRDMTLAGAEIREGEHTFVSLSAANRDPARFADPDRLDLARKGPPQIGFGHGPHYCLGHALGRLEGVETFKRLAQFSDRLLSEEWSARRSKSVTFRGLQSMHIGGLPAAS